QGQQQQGAAITSSENDTYDTDEETTTPEFLTSQKSRTETTKSQTRTETSKGQTKLDRTTASTGSYTQTR
uniref:Uncharacterized protein n=1 Tax=Romanomermis culicivorax TaxID=13658 RepID=A0A915HFZ2_ROMCU